MAGSPEAARQHIKQKAPLGTGLSLLSLGTTLCWECRGYNPTAVSPHQPRAKRAPVEADALLKRRPMRRKGKAAFLLDGLIYLPNASSALIAAFAAGRLIAPRSLLARINKLNQFFDSSVKLLSGSRACFSGQRVQQLSARFHELLEPVIVDIGVLALLGKSNDSAHWSPQRRRIIRVIPSRAAL